MGDEQRVSVSARDGKTVGPVETGETWCFQASGRWWDAFIPAGPSGYRFFLADALDIYPASRGRPFFELTAQVLERPEKLYPIGRSATVTFEHSGEVRLFANDVAGREKNNSGAIEVSYRRCDCPEPGLDAPVPGDLLGLWTLFRDTVDKTRGVGSAAVLSLGVCAILLGLQQGRDLVRTVAESDFSGQQVLFALMLLFLAIQTWIWPRMIISSNYGRDRAAWRPKAFLNWTPRILGLAPFVLVTIALLTNPAPNTWLIGGLVALGAAFFVIIIVQYDVRKTLRDRMEALEGAPRAPAPFGRWWVSLSTLIGLTATAWAIFWPVGFGWTLGAPAVVFLGVGCIIPVLTILVQTGQAARVPAVPALLAVVLFFGLWVDNHPVGWRAPNVPPAPPSPSRLTLEQAYGRWADQAPIGADGARTLVLVASEGGASRAGYWTAEVLGALHQASGGKLARNLFAISSVSGGSVGAVGYAAALQDRPGASPTEIRAAVTDFAGRDFLSPTVGGMLFPDLIQRFVPVALLPDRAQGLETAFARGWTQHCEAVPGCGTKDLLSTGFGALGPAAHAWRPIVVVNGASEESGRRILTSRLRFSPAEVDADDFYQLTGRDIPVATAIHNGARFPWISPAGTLTTAHARSAGHIVDGGYFEAAGVEVLREMAPALRRIAQARRERLRIVFVYIGYRERVAEAADEAAAQVGEPESPLHRALNEAIAPLAALFSSRSAHASHLIRELKQDVSGNPADTDPTTYASTPTAHYEPVLLCKQTSAQPGGPTFEPPMDWALSACAKAYMGKAAGVTPARPKVCAQILAQAIPCQKNLADAIARAARQVSGGPPEPRAP